MKTFIIILLFCLSCFARSRFVQSYDTTSLTYYKPLSSFTGFGTGKEWIKQSWTAPDTCVETTWNGGTAIKISSYNNTTCKVQRIYSPALDLSSYDNIELWLNLSPTKDTSMLIYVSTNTYTGYAFNSFQFRELPDSTSTIVLNFPINGFIKGGTGFNWANVDIIRLDYLGRKNNNTNYMTCWKMAATKTQLSKAQIMFTFDDGWMTQYDTAWQIMKTYNIRGSFSSVYAYMSNADTTPNSSFMATAKFRALQDSGNEVISHSWNHVNLQTISRDSAIREISVNKRKLDSLGLYSNKSKSIFIYPFGGANDSVLSFMPNYHSLAFISDKYVQKWMMTPNYTLVEIPRLVTYDNQKWTTNLKPIIDSTIKWKYPLVLGFHNITNYGTTRFGKTNFDTLCHYLDSCRTAGVCDIPLVTAYPGFKYSPDSIIQLHSSYSTDISIKLYDSLSTDMDTGRVVLYDSSATWDSVAGTGWKTGGQLCTLARSGLTSGHQYTMQQIVRNKNGTSDSTMPKQYISTTSTAGNQIGAVLLILGVGTGVGFIGFAVGRRRTS